MKCVDMLQRNKKNFFCVFILMDRGVKGGKVLRPEKRGRADKRSNHSREVDAGGTF